MNTPTSTTSAGTRACEQRAVDAWGPCVRTKARWPAWATVLSVMMPHLQHNPDGRKTPKTPVAEGRSARGDRGSESVPRHPSLLMEIQTRLTRTLRNSPRSHFSGLRVTPAESPSRLCPPRPSPGTLALPLGEGTKSGSGHVPRGVDAPGWTVSRRHRPLVAWHECPHPLLLPLVQTCLPES